MLDERTWLEQFHQVNNMLYAAKGHLHTSFSVIASQSDAWLVIEQLSCPKKRHCIILNDMSSQIDRIRPLKYLSTSRNHRSICSGGQKGMKTKSRVSRFRRRRGSCKQSARLVALLSNAQTL